MTELTATERETLAVAIHEALRCNCDSGEADRMVADEVAPAVEAILTARLARIEAEALANVPICSWHQNAYPDICWWCEISRNQNALRRAAQPTEGES